LLRAAGKQGLVRVDRDRHGVIRVFQGPATPAARISEAQTPVEQIEPADFVVAEAAAAVGVPIVVAEITTDEFAGEEEAIKQPLEDPTAVRLGTAGPKRRRSSARSEESAPARAPRSRTPRRRR
jgi:hypothetical protein